MLAALGLAGILGGWVGPGAAPIQGAPAQTDPLRVEVTGDAFRWLVRYPGPDGALHTPDDAWGERNVRLPAGRDVELVLRSRDYLYSLALPHAGLKEIAVPDLVYSMHLGPQRVGRFALLGDQFCGYSHAELIGELVVMPPGAFERWVRERAEHVRPEDPS